MDYIFSREEAEKELQAFIDEIELSGYFDEEKQYSIQPYLKNKGIMLGYMICKDTSGKKHHIKAFSGALSGSFSVKGFSDPCFSLTEFDSIVEQYLPRIRELTAKIVQGDDSLIQERQNLSIEEYELIKKIYRFHDLNGCPLSFADMNITKAPSGTGDCALIKMLNEAFKNGWSVISSAEIYFGQNIEGKKHRVAYPPCDEKCSLILKHILTLDIIYSDDHIVVINKPISLLSAPGIIEKDSVATRVSQLFKYSVPYPTVHRLDMDTSGVLVYAKTREAKVELFRQFEKRETEKNYVALLDGVVENEEGIIDLPMRLDVDNRPYQIVDFEQGKNAITHYKRIRIEFLDGKKVSRIAFYPKTGRTHQLRVHSASGLKMPILGDRLYGEKGKRL